MWFLREYIIENVLKIKIVRTDYKKLHNKFWSYGNYISLDIHKNSFEIQLKYDCMSCCLRFHELDCVCISVIYLLITTCTHRVVYILTVGCLLLNGSSESSM